MMAILKTGYQLNGKVPKIDTNTLRQEFFFTYGLKVIIGERSMSLTEAKGVYDRTFSFTAYAGDPRSDIKETLNPQGNAACLDRLERLHLFRKLMLIYRLIHFNAPVQDIETGLKRRNRELCKPILQLFCNSSKEIRMEIKSMLEYFLAIKKHRKENTVEVALYPIIANLVSEYGMEIPASYIWNAIIAGDVTGYYDERKPNEYQTADYGNIYRNTVTNIICDKFAAQRRHKDKGNVLIFDIDKLQRLGKSYELEANIQLKLPTEEKAERSEGSEGFTREHINTVESTGAEILNNSHDSNKISNQISNNASNNTNIEGEQPPGSDINPSEPSEPSVSNSCSHIVEDAVRHSTIYRLGHSDIFGCKNCNVRGGKFDMCAHKCGMSK
jgi:hypothetical protein